MSFRPIAAIAFLTLLTACGSAADSTTFQVPPDYRQSVSIGPFMQVWTGPDKESAVVLIAIPTTKIKLEDAMAKSDVHDTDMKVSKKITICGAQPAYYADMIGTVNTKTTPQPPNKRIEAVTTQLNGKTYVALYSRPLSAAVDPAADAAIKNICPKAS